MSFVFRRVLQGLGHPFIGTTCLATAMSSCAVQVPDHIEWPKAPTQLQGENAFVYDEITNCVDKLNRVRRVAKSQRDWLTSFQVGGGVLGVASGTASGVLDNDKDSTKNLLAFIAAGGALVAVLSPVVGNPKDAIKEHNVRAAQYQLISDAIFQLNVLATQKPKAPGPNATEQERAKFAAEDASWRAKVYDLMNRSHLASSECIKPDLQVPATAQPLQPPADVPRSAIVPEVRPAGEVPEAAPNSPPE